MLKACNGLRGHEKSHVKQLSDTLPNCKTTASGSSVVTSWKFFTLASVTRPLKFRQYAFNVGFHFGSLFFNTTRWLVADPPSLRAAQQQLHVLIDASVHLKHAQCQGHDRTLHLCRACIQVRHTSINQGFVLICCSCLHQGCSEAHLSRSIMLS